MGLIFILAYLIGSLPIGYLIAKIKGVDIFKEGSGNPGATNVGRVLGKIYGIITLILDAGKGIVAVIILNQLVDMKLSSEAFAWTEVGLGLVAVVGHNWSIFLKFKGGKGVATSAGVLLALDPISFMIAVLIFVMVLKIFKMVSLASIISSMMLPIIFIFFHKPNAYLCLSIVAFLFILIRHRTNIQRIIQGKEHKVG